MVHGHRNHAPVRASEKCSHPQSGIWAPDQDAVALANLTAIQFPRETVSHCGYIFVGPACQAIAAAFGIGLLTSKPLEIRQVVGDALPHGVSVTHFGI